MDIIKSMKRFCVCCMEEHEVQLVRVREQLEFKGTDVMYDAEYLYCDRADEYVAEEEMISKNDASMKAAYRKQNNLLSAEEIGKIRAKYGMSQSDFALVLGWGGKTITRYEGHQIQDMAHDSILRKVDSDPEWFLELLDRGKGRVAENVYRKYYEIIAGIYAQKQEDYLKKSIYAQYISFGKNEDYCGRADLDLDKVVEVIRYFANAAEMSHLYKVKLMKLLWYADALSYKRYGKAITGLVYKAMPMGAVPVAYKSIIELKGVVYEEEECDEGSRYHFVKTNGCEFSTLGTEEKSVLDRIIEICGNDTKDEIVNRMHEEKAYRETRLNEVILFQYAKDLMIH